MIANCQQQTDMFTPSTPEEDAITRRFEDWKQKPGAGKVLEMFYREAAFYFRRYQERHVGCSVALIEEKVRDQIRMCNLDAVPERGFALNCHFCSRIVRHMIENHPEWRAMFELREIRCD